MNAARRQRLFLVPLREGGMAHPGSCAYHGYSATNIWQPTAAQPMVAAEGCAAAGCKVHLNPNDLEDDVVFEH